MKPIYIILTIILATALGVGIFALVGQKTIETPKESSINSTTRIANAKLIIDNESYDINDLFEAKPNAEIYQDWVAIYSLPNNLGPNGGNVFINIGEDMDIKYEEIHHPWGNDRKKLLEFSEKIPTPKELKEKDINASYSIIGYDDFKLWYVLFLINKNESLGDSTPSPDMVGYADIKNKKFVFYTPEFFSEKTIPYIKRYVNIKNQVFLLGYKKYNIDIIAIKKGAPAYLNPLILVFNKENNNFTSIEKE